jgi:hypothetical protein
MEDYLASDGDTGGFDERQVQASHGYVGIYGMRWGTPLPGQPELSYAVQEFVAASAAGLPPGDQREEGAQSGPVGVCGIELRLGGKPC